MVLPSGCPGEAVLFEIQNPAGSLGTSKKRRRLRCLEEAGCRVLGEPG